jgi:hypothetical protein
MTKAIIFIDSGAVEEVLSDDPNLQCIVIDKDETDAIMAIELKDATDGTPFMAAATHFPVSVDYHDTQHYWNQIKKE